MEKNNEHAVTIDAAGKTLGRVAATAAKALMGKTTAVYLPHTPPRVQVTITNASKLYISDKKQKSTVYTSYTGHPGGLKHESLSQLISRKGEVEALRRAVEGMIPRNRLRTARLKRLNITA